MAADARRSLGSGSPDGRGAGPALGIVRNQDRSAISRCYILVETDSARHLLWARLAALRLSKEGVACVAVTQPPADAAAEALSVGITPESFPTGRAWPKCPGPFGGTTLLVVDENDLQSWLETEADDPIQRESRFHRLRIATDGADERGLRAVLMKLQQKTGRMPS